MTAFETPTDLLNNRGLIADPEAFAREKEAASWLYLCGEEFASVEGGMSYADVERAVPVSAKWSGTRPLRSTSSSRAGRSRRSTACRGRRW